MNTCVCNFACELLFVQNTLITDFWQYQYIIYSLCINHYINYKLLGMSRLNDMMRVGRYTVHHNNIFGHRKKKNRCLVWERDIFGARDQHSIYLLMYNTYVHKKKQNTQRIRTDLFMCVYVCAFIVSVGQNVGVLYTTVYVFTSYNLLDDYH